LKETLALPEPFLQRLMRSENQDQDQDQDQDQEISKREEETTNELAILKKELQMKVKP